MAWAGLMAVAVLLWGDGDSCCHTRASVTGGVAWELTAPPAPEREALAELEGLTTLR